MRRIRVDVQSSNDGLASPEWEKEVEHSVRVAKRVLSYLIALYPDLFQSKPVPWCIATDEDTPKPSYEA